jgi:prepilin-type N-terminal cleavage/methylation domain-containing protein
MKNKKLKAFTLVELMVVITIISILSGVTIIGLNSLNQKSQDTARVANIREIEIALESYKSVNGKYPDAGSQSTANYITNLTPTFIKSLPIEKGTGQTGTTGYHYAVSTDKRTYCFSVRGTVYNSVAQSDLNDTVHAKSWQVCHGPAAATLGPAN